LIGLAIRASGEAGKASLEGDKKNAIGGNRPRAATQTGVNPRKV
jgi:hypothetical protein